MREIDEIHVAMRCLLPHPHASAPDRARAWSSAHGAARRLGLLLSAPCCCDHRLCEHVPAPVQRAHGCEALANGQSVRDPGPGGSVNDRYRVA